MQLGIVDFPVFDKKYETLRQAGDFIEFEQVIAQNKNWDFDKGFDGPCLYLKTPVDDEGDLFYIAKVRPEGSSGGYTSYGFFVNIYNTNYGIVFETLNEALAYGENLLNDIPKMEQFVGVRPTIKEGTRALAEGIASGRVGKPLTAEQLKEILENMTDEERHKVQDMLKIPRT